MKYPFPQSVEQIAEPAADHLPASQAVQDVTLLPPVLATGVVVPVAKNVPAGQDEQEIAPAAENVPSPHPLRTPAPVPGAELGGVTVMAALLARARLGGQDSW